MYQIILDHKCLYDCFQMIPGSTWKQEYLLEEQQYLLCLPGHLVHDLRSVRQEILTVHRCPKGLWTLNRPAGTQAGRQTDRQMDWQKVFSILEFISCFGDKLNGGLNPLAVSNTLCEANVRMVRGHMHGFPFAAMALDTTYSYRCWLTGLCRSPRSRF